MRGSLLYVLAIIASQVFGDLPKYKSIDEAIARDDLQDICLQIRLYPERLNESTHSKLSPLHQAILRKKSDIALALIEAGASVDGRDASARTPLHLCAERDLPRVARALLSAGAKPDTLSKSGWTPLHYAAAKDSLNMAEVLIAGGANINALSMGGGTALHEAAASGGTNLVSLLIDEGVNPAVVDNDGRIASDIAIIFENKAVLLVLRDCL